MTDTTVPTYPETPAAVAAAVLDAIEAHPDAFYMGDWANLTEDQLLPDADPPCGTTLCAAGWAAHLTGWTLRTTDEDEPLSEVTIRLADGRDVPGYASAYAEKNGERREIGHVANQALGIQPGAVPCPWYAPDAYVLARLHEIAGR